MCIFSFRNFSHVTCYLSRWFKPDPVKVFAMASMSSPQNKEELRSFLGLVNHLGKFIPDLADPTAPLRQLLKKDSEWTFDHPQMQAFDKLKVKLIMDLCKVF